MFSIEIKIAQRSTCPTGRRYPVMGGLKFALLRLQVLKEVPRMDGFSEKFDTVDSTNESSLPRFSGVTIRPASKSHSGGTEIIFSKIESSAGHCSFDCSWRLDGPCTPNVANLRNMVFFQKN